MRVSPSDPFQIVYALYNHEYLGFLFESFAVQKDEAGRLTLRYQNISERNAEAFLADEKDMQLIRWMDQLQQEVIIKKFNPKGKRLKPADFFPKVFHPEKGNKPVQEAIQQYIQERIGKILEVLSAHKTDQAFVMGKDGTPIQDRLVIESEPAEILFHFFKNETNTHYYPTIRHQGQKLDFRTPESMVICFSPAWLLVANRLYHFKEDIDGRKLKPFVKKKFILIPESAEERYYRKFVAPLIANHEVRTHGFDVVNSRAKPEAKLLLSLLPGKSYGLFDEGQEDTKSEQVLLQLAFRYEDYLLQQHHSEQEVTVKLKEEAGTFTFYRIRRVKPVEEKIEKLLIENDLPLQKGRYTCPKSEAFSWLGRHSKLLSEAGIELIQHNMGEQKYFIGSSTIEVEVSEDRDWFDIKARVRFGDHEIPFLKLRRWILEGKREFELPNGELAVIPEEWFTQYSELFSFLDTHEEQAILKKHHVSLVFDLHDNRLASVSMSQKLERLREFQQVEEVAVPEGFQGELRPYQKAGYDWMQFLQSYQFGGCLADDMGLGKTVQTLALIQAQKEADKGFTSLLIVPTSLIHNWRVEAKKFTPKLRILEYVGSDRNKDVSHFSYYDIILTSYGIVRMDIDILKQFYFHYAILDESQAIKNPNSAISKGVRELSARHRLILTGTPIENTTMDLWSQMSFINPGLLGTKPFFKKTFQQPIEKKQDKAKKQRLYKMTKPFILRRSKMQVAKELPDKIENIQYCTMSRAHEKFYQEAKSYYRNQILEHIETKGVNKSQIILLQGLTRLRLIANHPVMVDESYAADSGKLENIIYKLEEVLSESHKVLIFSQFVKHLTLIRSELTARKIRFAYLDGSTRDRQKQVRAFQEEADCRAFLLSIKAGGVGLNLTAADYVFVLDPWWNPAVEAQAIDRAHRIGQENQVFIYKFITEDTVEEKILRLQQEKQQLAEELITTEDTFTKGLSKEDIAALFD